jgi:hypothetical protein
MIQKVILRRFKRFEQIEVPLGEHVVFAGPNNSLARRRCYRPSRRGPRAARWLQVCAP